MLNDRGSALALVPAGFLVLIILAALAVDSAGAYLGQQRLHDAISAAATDAATAGLSNQAYYSGGTLTIDQAAAARTVCLAVAAQSDRSLHTIHLSMGLAGDAIRLHASATVDAVFGSALPGFGQRRVQADVTAIAADAPRSAGTAPKVDSLSPLSCPGAPGL